MTLEMPFVLSAVQKALLQAVPLICNSDQGSYFTSPLYCDLLRSPVLASDEQSVCTHIPLPALGVLHECEGFHRPGGWSEISAQCALSAPHPEAFAHSWDVFATRNSRIPKHQARNTWFSTSYSS